MKKLNQKGDTIVEVLLSLSVLSLVIGVSYSISSRSLIRAQQAQERIQATKLAEEQVDLLKYLAENDAAGFSELITGVQVSGRCIERVGSVLDVINPADGVGFCKKDELFTYLVSSYASGTKTFTIKVEWDAFRGISKENVTMYYKVQNQ